MNKDSIYAIVTWVIVIALLFTFSFFRNADISNVRCPEKILGNESAKFSIKYFESPFCVYCWFEEPIIKSLVKEKGDLFSIAYYDIRYCNDEVDKYQITGTPTFVYSMGGKEYVEYGYTVKEKVLMIICEGSGGC